jgi:hypothetical protein
MGAAVFARACAASAFATRRENWYDQIKISRMTGNAPTCSASNSNTSRRFTFVRLLQSEYRPDLQGETFTRALPPPCPATRLSFLRNRAPCPPAPPCKTTTTIWSPALRRYARRHTARAQHAIKGCGSRAETPMLLALALDCSSHRALASLASSSQLREKREELNRSIAADEEEKGASSPSPHRRCAQLLASFVSLP